jgi:hypothetical protein
LSFKARSANTSRNLYSPEMTIQWSYPLRHVMDGIYAFDLSWGTKIKSRGGFQQLDGDLGNRSDDTLIFT